MQPKTKAKLKYELNRICRVVDFAEDTKIADNFIVARKAVYNLIDFIDGLIAGEVAEQLAGLVVEQIFPETKTVPTSERCETAPVGDLDPDQELFNRFKQDRDFVAVVMVD